jgi:hypothetical protein
MKQKKYTAKLIQVDRKPKLLVAEASSSDMETTEREIKHYLMVYAEDGEFEIKRNYKLNQGC